MSYVGGPGYELYVPVEMARHVYLALHEAGADLGLRDSGYFALDALRIEAGRRAWGHELGPDETPWQAGLAFAVKMDKRDVFIGREALQRTQHEALTKKLLCFVLDDRAAYVWGGESILIDGAPVGELSSAGWSTAAGVCVGLGYVRGTAARLAHQGTLVVIDLWGEAIGATAWDASALLRPGLKPAGSP